MTSAVLVCLFLVAVAMAHELSVEQEFANFKTRYNKIYKDEEEEATRYKVFTENLNNIKEHNKKFEAGEVTFKQGVNQFADLTPEEFKQTHLGGFRSHPA